MEYQPEADKSIKGTMKQLDGNSIRRILVPVDFSPASLRALDYAVERARECGATILLLHVVDRILVDSRFVSPRLRGLKADARLVTKRLLSLAKKRVRVDAPVSPWLLNGEPSAMIIKGAADLEVDSIIMGSGGRKGLGRLVLGSVAERVIRNAHCPVTIVRAPQIPKQRSTQRKLRAGPSERAAIVLIGPPGSGKTTIARAIKERTSLSVIEIGNLLKDQVKRGTKLGRLIKPYVSAGSLVPLEYVMNIVSAALKEADEDIVLFDGIPRSTAQILPFLQLLVDHRLTIEAVIYLKMSLPTAIKRINGRRVCRECGTVSNIAARSSKSTTRCERCGGPLIQRQDDNECIVRKRFKRFERETMPVIAFFKDVFNELTWEQTASTPEKQLTDRIWQRLERAFSNPDTEHGYSGVKLNSMTPRR